MKKLYINSMLSLSCLFMINSSFANINMINMGMEQDTVRNGDSVMTPGTMSKPPLTTVNKKQGGSTNYSPNQSIEYNSASCPAGYSNGGGNTFHTGQRLITSFYSNGQLMKTTTGDWMAVNESCSGTEDQTVTCPSGYTGNVQQRRTVTYNTSGYNYGGWSDISNSCVVIPPPPPPVVVVPPVVVPPVVVPPVVVPPVVVPPVVVPPVVAPPESTSRSWYQNSDWSEFDAYAYSGSSKAYYDCVTAYGTANIIIYYGTGGNGRPDQGIPEYQKAVAPGGACYCDEKSPNGAYIASGIGGDYSWRQEYLCLTDKQIQEYEDFKYGR